MRNLINAVFFTQSGLYQNVIITSLNYKKITHRMPRLYAEPCHNILWVIFCFAFVGVCFVRNGLRIDKTISVRLYGALCSYRFAILAFHSRHRYNPLLSELANVNAVYKFAVGDGFA